MAKKQQLPLKYKPTKIAKVKPIKPPPGGKREGAGRKPASEALERRLKDKEL